MKKINKNKTRRQKPKILAHSSLIKGQMNQRFLACLPRRGQSNKRGELTTQQIVMLIILIISFVVILFLLFRLNLGRMTDKEICHNSVVLKSKGKGLIGRLDCKTNYLCISGGGECEGINPTETIKINMKKEDEIVKQEIMKAIADEMIDCWWMFGEGEMDYLKPGDYIGIPCAICSIIKFDDRILDYEISYREFYEYLNSINKDESQKYFTYIYDSYDVNKFQEELSHLEIDIDNNYILDDDKYSIVTGYRIEAKKNPIFPPYYLKTDQISSELGCKKFITES